MPVDRSSSSSCYEALMDNEAACSSDAEMLQGLQRGTFSYFERYANPNNGLIADSSDPDSPSSIAAVGLGLSVLVVAVERGFIARDAAAQRTLSVLRFLHESPQSDAPDATGYKGFYYHFLDMRTGRRTWDSELSTVDTALLMAGVLTSQSYFDKASADETEIRDLADTLYRRVDWAWATTEAGFIGHGWSPEAGQLPHAWDRGYSEALILYILALGSPTCSTSPADYKRWTATFERKTAYDIDHIYAGPLFIHQLSQVWLDLRETRDDLGRSVGFDYFENSRRATLVQRAYGIDNPHGFARYSENAWGLTASDGPGPAVLTVDGIRREFFGYLARGAPFGPDDGTISPWAVVASLPFAPEVVIPTVHHVIDRLALHSPKTGLDASFNATFPERGRNPHAWVSPRKIGLNEGPIILMIENYTSGLVWKLLRACPYVVSGMRRAGFEGGWLKDAP